MPLRHTIHRDKALENVSVAYRPNGLIADMLPKVPVTRESDVYYVYSRDMMTIPETIRVKGRANRATWTMSTSSYLLENHALQDYVYDRDKRNADKAINLEIDTTEALTMKVALRYEKQAATLLQGSANFSNNTSLTSDANFLTNTVNPITVIDSGTSVIAQNSGFLPNTLIFNDRTFRTVKEHSLTVDRIKHTSADSINEAMLARLFSVDRLLVGRGVENTGEEQLSDTMSFIWTDTAFLGYLESSPGLKKASAVYTFVNSGINPKVDRWREEEEEADAIRVQREYQHKAVATSCAFLIIDTV